MNSELKAYWLVRLSLLCIFSHFPVAHWYNLKPGEVIDEFNSVEVYYNGDMSNVFGRNLTSDGYNLGLKYQCVEFVKRYYYYIYQHRMPDSYGHAMSFFDKSLEDGTLNTRRGLIQFSNGSSGMPSVGDIVVFDSDTDNPFGHLGIISMVNKKELEIIQQNVGRHTRVRLPMVSHKGKYYISNRKLLGWLRMSCHEN